MSNSITIYPDRGFRATSSLTYTPTKSGGGKRSKVTGFSSSSRRRFRNFMLTNTLPEHYHQFAITLTVPGPLISLDDKQRLWEGFKDWCKYHKVPCVWRLEIQRRGQPHWHLCVGLQTIPQVMALRESWMRCLSSLGPVDVDGRKVRRNRIKGALEHAVRIDPYDGSSKWLRYMCDHMSKSSHQEADCHGRHWGKINARLFVPADSYTIKLSDSEFARVSRWQRRLTTGVKSPNRKRYFKSRRGLLNRGSSISFGSTGTLLRMIEHACLLSSLYSDLSKITSPHWSPTGTVQVDATYSELLPVPLVPLNPTPLAGAFWRSAT